jgi:hypothetical protein
MLFYGDKDNFFLMYINIPQKGEFILKVHFHPFGGLTRKINPLPLYFEN